MYENSIFLKRAGIGSVLCGDVDDDGFGNGANRPGLYGDPRQSGPAK